MFDRDKYNSFGERINTKCKDKSETIFESGRESRRRIRKQNRKQSKF